MPLSTLHQIDVFDRDRAAIAEVGDENGEADRRLRCSHGEDEQSENLSHQIAQKGREGDEVDVNREENELDRHQDDDHVLPIEENTEDPECEQNGGYREIVADADGHIRCPNPAKVPAPAVP